MRTLTLEIFGGNLSHCQRHVGRQLVADDVCVHCQTLKNTSTVILIMDLTLPDRPTKQPITEWSIEEVDEWANAVFDFRPNLVAQRLKGNVK